MLTSDQLDALIQPVLDFYRDFESQVIADIARRIIKVGNVTATAAWMTQRLSESGAIYQDILKRLARLTGKSESMLAQLFEQAGVKSSVFDDKLYVKAGLRPIPLNMSPAMINVLAAGMRKTVGIVENLALSTAVAGQRAFIDAVDMAYAKVVTGTFDYNAAIRTAIKDMASQGIRTVEYASQVDFADVAVRRAVLTGVAQTTGNLQMARANELGADLVQTSAHQGSRPEHEPWQGRVFSLSGTSDKYPDFVSSTGYGEVDGLMGVNCRHTFYPFFEGFSEKAYSQATLDEYANKTIMLNGEKISQYEASQVQRGIERHIRAWKRQRDALDAAGLSSDAETAKVKEWQGAMRAFIKQTGLNRQRVREQVV